MRKGPSMRLERLLCAFLLFLLIAACTLLPAAAVTDSSEIPVLQCSSQDPTGRLRLTWEDVDGAKSYRIYRSTRKTGNYDRIKSTSATSYTDSSAKVGKTYYYCVKAVYNNGGTSDTSNKVSGMRNLAQPGVSLSTATAGAIKIRWAKVSGASSYRVYRSTDTVSWMLLAKTKSSSYSDFAVEAGINYHYQVQAVTSSGKGNSLRSSALSGIPQPSEPLPLSIKLNTKGMPYLTWNRVSGAVKYRVYRSYTKDSGYSLVTTRSSQTFCDTKAPSGVALYYRVKAVDASAAVINMSLTASISRSPQKKETLKTRYVALPMVKLYEAPTDNSQFIRLGYMEQVQRGNAVFSDWHRVFYRGKLYYMRIKNALTSQKSRFQYRGRTEFQQQIIDLALEISEEWPTTYARGQSNGIPNADGTYGFNCSGLVGYVFNTVMQKHIPTYNLEPTLASLCAIDCIYNSGYPGEFEPSDIKKTKLQPGDILFFNSLADGSDSDQIGHCGIYLGNNEFVHSTSILADDAVCIMPLTDSYLKNLVRIRRCLPKTTVPANTKVTLHRDCETYSIYESMSRSAPVVTAIPSSDPVTVLFTDSHSWAYVRTAKGEKGFLPLQYIK